MDSGTKHVYSLLMNCAAPVLTLVFLAGSACWAAELKYGEPIVYDKDPEAVAAFSERGLSAVTSERSRSEKPLAKQELSERDAPKCGSISRKKPSDEPAVTANSGAELVEAQGIYIGDEFIGAVTDAEGVEEKLSEMLDGYRSEDSVIQADFAVEPDIKAGIYRTETLVDEDTMSSFLAGEKKVVSEYTADGEDTPEKIAGKFGMSVDEIKQLNPSLETVRDGEQVRVKENVSVLPVKYVREEQEEEAIEISTFHYNNDYELVSDGISGKRISTFEVTYIDDEEVSRRLMSAETVELPCSSDEDGSESIVTESIPEAEGIFSDEFIWPVCGGSVSDPFGGERNHKGMDIAAPAGTDIYASDGGTVIEAGWNDGGYGNYVMIDHGNGYVTLYAHASEVFVSAGDTVSQGELIAAVGTTGDSTGNHCHFEVRYGGEYLDPAQFV